MQTYQFILSAFILPFALFLLLSKLKNLGGDSVFVLMMCSAFLWLTALGATILYVVSKYVFTKIEFGYCYLFSLGFGLGVLIIWTIFKSHFTKK